MPLYNPTFRLKIDNILQTTTILDIASTDTVSLTAEGNTEQNLIISTAKYLLEENGSFVYVGDGIILSKA